MNAPFAWVAIFFILGILVGSYGNVPLFYFPLIASVSLIISILFLKKKRGVVALLILVLISGALFYKNSQIFGPTHILKLISDKPHPTLVRGVIINSPHTKQDRFRRKNTRFLFRFYTEKSGNDWQKREGTVYATIYGGKREYLYGDELILAGEISKPHQPTNPGQFDYSAYLQRQSVYGLLRVKDSRDVIFIKNHLLNPFLHLAFSIKDKIMHSIEEHLPSPERELFMALLLGERSDIPAHLKRSFVWSGTIHILPTQYTKKHIFQIPYLITS